MVDMTVLPYCASFLRSKMTCKAVVESSPVVGSSRKMIPGLVTNSTPIDVLFRYPPEIPLMKVFPIFVSAHELKPKSLISSLTLSLISSSLNPSVSLAANRKHSLGVKVPSKASYCITYPIWFE
jgi:hypothetical protein